MSITKEAFRRPVAAANVKAMTQSFDLLPDIRDFICHPTWQAEAACRDHDMNAFFPHGPGISPEIHEICAGCLVFVECLKFALADPSLKGVWAGTSERKRGRMRAAMRNLAELASQEQAPVRLHGNARQTASLDLQPSSIRKHAEGHMSS
jgi:hypothetical protein